MQQHIYRTFRSVRRRLVTSSRKSVGETYRAKESGESNIFGVCLKYYKDFLGERRLI